MNEEPLIYNEEPLIYNRSEAINLQIGTVDKLVQAARLAAEAGGLTNQTETITFLETWLIAMRTLQQ